MGVKGRTSKKCLQTEVEQEMLKMEKIFQTAGNSLMEKNIHNYGTVRRQNKSIQPNGMSGQQSEGSNASSKASAGVASNRGRGRGRG